MSSWIRRAVSVTAVAAASAGSLIAFAPPTAAATVACSALTSPVYKTINPTLGDQLLTISATEARSSASAHGFTTNHGVLGYASKAPAAGLVPVTRMFNPKAVDFLWVTSAKEIAAAKLYGYQTQNVNFYAAKTKTACTVAVHKFAKGDHRRNAVTAADRRALTSAGWKDVGVAFYLKSATAAPASPTPAPTPAKPAPTPTPTPAPVTAPPTGGYGVPAGTKLTVVNGDMTITKAGTVVSNVDLRGHLLIQADNVTVKNSVIRGGAAATKPKALIQAWWQARNLQVVNTTLKAANRSLLIDGISGSNYTADRLDVSGIVDAAKVIGPNVTIRNSWFHDAIHSSNDPNQPDRQTHDDGIQLEGGSNVVIENNKIGGFHNAALQVTQNYSATHNVTVRNNQLSGGGCQINVTQKGRGGAGKAIYAFSITGNGFGTGLFGSTCPMRLPKTSTFTVSGNYWLTNRLAAFALRF
ncbi:MAG TPA: right-handed parallel beta-helix repeat-containing protein [Propionicimonas sp.]|jgi:hypothetical protein|uniref:right-handed parallel beta-helix repeat-containing protein n=1 Tax=Propionicimonas sp. TaxID=1955623 RepID=UPI002F41ECE8